MYMVVFRNLNKIIEKKISAVTSLPEQYCLNFRKILNITKKPIIYLKSVRPRQIYCMPWSGGTILTVSGPVQAPQKFLLSQQFRYLMRCKKYLKKNFLSCLVSEIQLFVYIFRRNSKWRPEVQKGSPVKIFKVSYYKNFF